jgi:hypothetical protein
MGHPLNLKAFFPNSTMIVVLLRGENVRSPSLIGALFDSMRKKLYENLAHYVFPSELEELGKRATILTIARTLRRFTHALNKFYV